MHDFADTSHCPTCGSELDTHALMIMERNRNARDAQFRDFARQIERQDEADSRWWRRFQLGSIAAFAVVTMGWMIWASASIVHLQEAAR